MDPLVQIAVRCLDDFPRDGRSRVVAVAGTEPEVVDVFDGHPFDRLVGCDEPDGDAVVLVTPDVLPPSVRLGTGPSRPGAAATAASLEAPASATVAARGARIPAGGLVADLARRIAGHDVPLPAPLIDVLGSWWVGLVDAVLDDPAGVGDLSVWDTVAGLRPDLLLAFLADAATAPDGVGRAVTPQRAFLPATAAVAPTGLRLLRHGADAWVVSVHDAAVAGTGRSRCAPPFDRDEAAWLGPSLLARLEVRSRVPVDWRARARALWDHPAVPSPMAVGLVEVAAASA